ncbi:MAG: SDR family oxidoreductase [Lachnospiraceae bacterium]|nr:SDR family oxidoreductase [Lachnospiraceae bacterium]
MENKVYFITGASSEVGIAFIRSLEEKLKKNGEKATVVAHYAAHDEALLALKEGLSVVTLMLQQADLSQPEEVKNLIVRVAEICECPDCILHLPAAKLSYNRIKQLDWQNVLRDMEIQVHSLGEIGKYFLPKMGKRGKGKVAVMLTACTVGMPPKFMSQYVLVKYALLGLMKSMAVEFAEKGVNVNGISPNMMETKFLDNIDGKIIEMNREASTMKRNVRVEEVLPAIHLLLSEGSDYMNGVNLNLTGGDR